MKFTIHLTLTLLMILSTGFLFGSDRYDPDVAHSTIGFSVKHMVISTVAGKFHDFSGVINYDDRDITKSSVDISINVDSIDTGNEKRDAHLKSADFFDVKSFPAITFKSSRIQKNGEGYAAHGTLTMHGVSKEITLPFTITGIVNDPWGGTRAGIETEITLNRQDFGISWSQVLDNGGLVVSNDVKVSISLELVKAEQTN